MNKDTRITLGLALVYFLNGFFQYFGPNRAFAPLVFIDSFLLALLSLVFVVWPPFRRANLLFLLFFVHFALQGCYNTGLFRNVTVDIANQLLIIGICAGLYVYTVVAAKRLRWMALVPALLFVLTMLLRYAGASPGGIVGAGIFSACWQVYLLARPDLAQQHEGITRRFYLLMVCMLFFDAVYQAFLYMNFSPQPHP